jgi:hypothetical protein
MTRYDINTNEFGFIFLMQFGFMFIALIWKFDFSPFMVLIIAILNDGKVLNLFSYTTNICNLLFDNVVCSEA